MLTPEQSDSRIAEIVKSAIDKLTSLSYYGTAETLQAILDFCMTGQPTTELVSTPFDVAYNLGADLQLLWNVMDADYPLFIRWVKAKLTTPKE